jgi:C1A family cysteine protease
MMEYFENRSFNKVLDASRLFLYKATRNLMKETGDNGGYLRFAMGAMALFCLPSMFGFSVCSSFTQAETTGKIPYPAKGEKIAGGHAVMAVGYDDKLKIKNTNAKGPETTGALLIRNSWGEGWGEKGYGWLPYAYVLEGLADEFWSLIKSEWIETGEFSL